MVIIKRLLKSVLLLLVTTTLAGTTVLASWKAKEIAVVDGLDIPECVLVDTDRNAIYISNIETSKEEFWFDDGSGFLSALTSDFKMKSLRWVDTKPGNIINAPKGMSVYNGYLYFNDNRRLMRAWLKYPSVVERVIPTTFGGINDQVAYDDQIWISDTNAGVVFAIDPEKGVINTVVQAPPSVNGITFSKGKMYAVSWGEHDVYELDPTGKAAPVAFGLASHFKNLDGIEVLDDGTFIITDWVGNKVSTITPDRKTVETIIEINSAADPGLDRINNILYVPSFMKNRAVAYQLYQD